VWRMRLAADLMRGTGFLCSREKWFPASAGSVSRQS
jgi:hypothetical protein